MASGQPVAEAFVRVRPSTAGFGRELQREVTPQVQRVERSLRSSEREFSRFGRGALVGTGALGGLGRAAAFASTSFIGGAGLVYAIKSTISAAGDAEVSLGQMKNALDQQGISFDDNRAAIDRRVQALSLMAGIDDELVQDTFVKFVRRTGDVTRSLDLSSVAINVARGRQIDLATATALVTRASLGQAGALRRLGIEARKGATGLELVDLLSQKYAGSAEAYGKTAVGAQDRFRVAVENTQEAIGKELLPDLTLLLNKTTKWLNEPKNQKKITDDATKTTHALGEAFKWTATQIEDAADAYKRFKSITSGGAGSNPFNIRVPGFIPGSGSRLLFGKFAQDAPGIVGGVGGGNFDVGLRPDDRAVGGRRNSDGTITPATGKTATPKPTSDVSTGIPWLDNLLARAEATAGRGDDEQVLRRIRRVLAARLAKAKGLGARTKIQQALNQFTDQLAGLTEQDAREIQDRLDAKNQKIADAADLAARRERSRISVWQERQAELAAGRQRRADRLAARVQALTQTPVGLTLEEQIAEQNSKSEKDLLPILQKERESAIKRLAIVEDLEKKKKASANDVLQAELTLATTNRRIRDIKQADKAASGFSLTDLYAEAGNELALHGSNVGPAGAPLSRQDAHGALAGAIYKQGNQYAIVQHFHGERNAAQAIVEAARAAQAVR